MTKGPNKERKLITDYEVIPFLFHSKKEIILKLLMKKEMNIIQLKRATGINPGTIRRHLDELIEKELVVLHHTVKTKYGQTMKFYTTTAKRFDVEISFSWP